MKMKFLAIGLMCTMTMIGCSRDAQVASKNLSYAADNFELDRRIVFITGLLVTTFSQSRVNVLLMQ